MIRYTRYPGGKTKALILSYDDAQVTDRAMVSVLNEYGIRATFHLNFGRLDTKGYIHADEVRQLYEGHEIAAHSYSHPYLFQLPQQERLGELWTDRERLEELTGTIVEGFSYPYGEYDESMIELVRMVGFSYARTIESQFDYRLPENFYAWHPTCHHREDSVELAKRYLDRDERQGLSAFFLWGHSHNFEREKNWHVLDEFCRLMGGREEIWYCTMGEFARYVTACRQLRTSLKGDIVYNPTDREIWFEWNGDLASVCGGQTRRKEEI